MNKNTPQIKFLKLEPNAKIPAFATSDAAGLDITSVESAMLKSMSCRAFKTGLCVEIPTGYELQIRPRSSLALRHNIFVLNSPGTIDSDYRGEILVILFNLAPSNYEIRIGDKIAQLVLNKLCDFEILQVDSIIDLSKTKRGKGGFGSTGR